MYKKFFDIHWKLLDWIVYISLVGISVWFTWGVLIKFSKQETTIRQYEDKIDAHPTISICGFSEIWEYQKDFNITYITYDSDGFSVEDEAVLAMGENDLGDSRRIINLTIIFTRYNSRCFVISTTRKVDESKTEIKLWSAYYAIGNRAVFFTSEKNSYGVTRRDWRDGEVFSFDISRGNGKDLTLTVEKNINLKCSEVSFYEYVASKLSQKSFGICNDACLRTSLPNDPYPMCPNSKEWYDSNDDSDCNYRIENNLIQNITNNDEHPKTCITTQYSGISQEWKSSENEAKIKYKFSLPLKARVYHEYFIIDSIGLIGSVGGTLGMFIGFSFSNLIICIIEYIQSLMRRKLGLYLISMEMITRNILKCLKWVIYLSLMATAILFTRNVIEKFFDQNIGIKQNTEKIEPHPVVTICPFLDQFDGSMTLILRLQGEAKAVENLASYEGSYDIFSSEIINDKPYWTHTKNDTMALWYNAKQKLWVFGLKIHVGSSTGALIGMHSNTVPYKANTWYYLNNNQWINTVTDVVLLSGLNIEDSIYYGINFNITYQILENDRLTPKENITLEIGENHLPLSREKVTMSKIYTRWNSICYKINTSRKADFRTTEIRLKISGSKYFEKTIEFFFTSEENFYGITNNKFMDGKTFSTQLNEGNWKEIYLSVEKNKNWVCSKDSFFEYVASRLTERNFENCTYACLRTSLPYDYYPICPNYEDWYDNVLSRNLTDPEDDCNWGVVRDLIRDIIAEDEHMKNCETTDYSGKIITEKEDQESNELGIQYKFTFPLRAKVYQEFLLTDIIDLLGSVGGMLGLFIGFSFSNIISCLIEYIGALWLSRSKLCETLCISIEWIIYLSLMATSIWFSWGVLDKFFKEETGIQQYEEQIDTHPTIVICISSLKYQIDFDIQHSLGEKVTLEIGENYLETIKENVTLTKVFTRKNGLCYAIKTTQKVDEKTTFITIASDYNLPKTIPVIFTSEMNSYGVIQRDWRDGEVFSFVTSGGNKKDIDLTVKKNGNLKCSNESFYEYIASRLSEDTFEKCNEKCLMTSLPSDQYHICQDYYKWYDMDTKGKESNCNWHILRDLIHNITINEEHLKTCVTTQYLGKITMDVQHKYKNAAFIMYKFALPLKAKVYDEYLITDGFTLIGSVGGTLGLFIGFSFHNFVHNIMEFLKSTLNRRLLSAATENQI